MDPKKEYQSRVSEWSRRAQALEQAHLRMGNLRIFFVIGLFVLAAVLCRSHVALGFVLTILIVGLFLTGMRHIRIENARDSARRAIRFYQSGLERLDGTWMGKGSHGTEFLDLHHPYAADLDLFGPGSLFELLNAAHTQNGRATLAAWLLEPAPPQEILARQEAIKELRPQVDLRERLGLLTAEAQGWIRTQSLISWARQPRVLNSNAVRVTAFCLPWVSLFLLILGQWQWCLTALAAQYALARSYRKRVQQVTRSAGVAQQDLEWLAAVFDCLEAQHFQSERLRRMDAECQCDGRSASQAIQRLAWLYSWLDSSENQLFRVISAWFLWETQFAFAVEAWRTWYGMMVEPWLRRLGEIEALSSLAGYAFEHPADPFPELLPNQACGQVEAEGLGHPLIAEARCVRNDVLLGPNRRLVVISGSNMSGKSTYLRAIGVNLVLALAGAPVRSRKLRMTHLRIGASIRILDSLQGGTSRFYAEIARLSQIVKLAEQGTALVFLLDEILGGTNSHDRRIGAGCVARALVERGAIGLMTTHDLALARIAEELQPPGANDHFEDQIVNGKMSFDYRLRPGVVQKSNALELMRSVGLAVKE
ncbi:MAG TPA: DNA mismatch repair protein MutS [Candidatus Angelobacter sp.]|nr:DNA mismatch repair protein MutS [Candidatus Angelobacter sp.]